MLVRFQRSNTIGHTVQRSVPLIPFFNVGRGALTDGPCMTTRNRFERAFDSHICSRRLDAGLKKSVISAYVNSPRNGLGLHLCFRERAGIESFDRASGGGEPGGASSVGGRAPPRKGWT